MSWIAVRNCGNFPSFGETLQRRKAHKIASFKTRGTISTMAQDTLQDFHQFAVRERREFLSQGFNRFRCHDNNSKA